MQGSTEWIFRMDESKLSPMKHQQKEALWSIIDNLILKFNHFRKQENPKKRFRLLLITMSNLKVFNCFRLFEIFVLAIISSTLEFDKLILTWTTDCLRQELLNCATVYLNCVRQCTKSQHNEILTCNYFNRSQNSSQIEISELFCDLLKEL